MDTVTEARLATRLEVHRKAALALSTKTCLSSVRRKKFCRVKKHESGGIRSDPQTVLLTTIHEVKALTERNGFAGYPVVTEDNELVGIITGRDVRLH